MSRGGKRLGAGRKPGGANRKSRELADKAAESGLTPLAYMLAVVNDPTADPLRRDDLAKAAAPYCHSRISNSIPPPSGEAAGSVTTINVIAVPSGTFLPPDDLEVMRLRRLNLNNGDAVHMSDADVERAIKANTD